MNAGTLRSVMPVMWVLWVGHFLVDFMIGIWPLHKTMMQLDLGTVGLMTAGCVVVGEGLQLLFGTLSDNGYRRAVFIFGLLGTSCAAFYAYAEDYTKLFFLLSFTCIGSGAFHPAASSFIGSLPNREKGFLFTFFASGGALGLGSSQMIYAAYYDAFDGRTFLLVIPAILLAFVVMSFSFIRLESSSRLKKKRGIDFAGIKRFFSSRDLALLYLMQVSNQTVFWALVFLLPDLLIGRGYDSWISYGGGHLILIMGAALMMVPAGYLADKYTPKSVLLISSLVGMIAFYAFICVYSLPISLLLFLLFTLGAAVGLGNPVAMALGNQIMPGNPGVVGACLMGLVWVASEGLGQGCAGFLTRMFVEDAAGKALAILGAYFMLAIFASSKLSEAECVGKLEDQLG